MKRDKKIVIVSHCILNQNSVVEPCAREMKNFKKFIDRCYEKNIGIIQLPCPEFLVYGAKRNGYVKSDFLNQKYLNKSNEILESILIQIKEYLENGYKILGIFGILGSPSCGISETCEKNSKGDVILIKEKGIYMEILEEKIKELNIPFYDIERFEDDML